MGACGKGKIFAWNGGEGKSEGGGIGRMEKKGGEPRGNIRGMKKKDPLQPKGGVKYHTLSN